ncbi:hypothetical protein [Pseudoxanthomonas sangjuensis]|uniref:hypothetical protein n=1 Tax=Pseudoxanthomonas sangjuensis TaxID=1503750 RepID=UPI001390DEB7|nr:hypothetical protein [Pseudoxanthomonas sangjuensis]
MNVLRESFELPDPGIPCACCVRESMDAAGIAVECTDCRDGGDPHPHGSAAFEE